MVFIFADLIIVPIILIYRKYYVRRLAPRNVGISYLMTVTGGYLIERVFRGLGLVPAARSAKAAEAAVHWNYMALAAGQLPGPGRRLALPEPDLIEQL